MYKRVALLTIALSICAAEAVAQDWGVSLAITPQWETGPGINNLFAADRIDMRGSELRVGFVRGWDIEGDWGLSFIKTTIADNSSVDVGVSSCGRGSCGTFLKTIEPTRMTGFEVHKYEPFKTWRNRVQIGMVGAIGLGWMQGQVYKRTTGEDADVETYQANASELFPPTQSVVPLLRMEVAGSAIVVPGLKVRASGGFAMPGYHVFGLTFLYMVPR